MVVQEQSLSAIADLEDEPRCCHHWIIQPANGPISQGQCLNCGEEREFKNTIEEAQEDWHNI